MWLENAADVIMVDISGTTPLHRAALEDSQSTVLHLLEQGALVNAVNEQQNTALHWSAFRDSHKTALALLQHGVDVDAANSRGLTALHTAATNNSVNTVRLLLHFNANIDRVDSSGSSALHFAAMNNRDEIISILVKHGANINLANADGRTPLHFAMTYNCNNAAICLINQGTGFGSVSFQGKAVLHWAVENNNRELVGSLIERGADVNAVNKEGSTVLHWAVLNNPELYAFLLANGADVNTEDKDGATVLHWTAANNPELAVSVISHGADVNVKNQHDVTALHLAAVNNYKELAVCLLKSNADVNAVDKDGNSALHKAAENSSKDVASILVEYGADVNAVNDDGETALSLAVKSDCRECLLQSPKQTARSKVKDDSSTALDQAARDDGKDLVQLLVEQGANVDSRDRHGNTALHFAISKSSKTISCLLLDHGAYADAEDQNGNNAMHFAAALSDKEMASLLVSNVGDVNAKNKLGETSLHRVAEKDNSEVAAILLGHGAHVNSVDNVGNTPLHYACTQIPGDATARLFVIKGADVDRRNKVGQTALHSAVTAGNLNAAKLLLECGAKVNVTDDRGNTPLHLALSAKKFEFVDLFLQKPDINVNNLNEDCNSLFHLLAQIPLPHDCVRLQFKSKIAEIARELLAKGALVNVRNRADQTALHLARNACTAEVLLRSDAWPNAKELYNGNTPLLSCAKMLCETNAYFCERGDLQAMIDMGMDPWIANYNGDTVLGTLLETNDLQAAHSAVHLMKGKRNSSVNKKHSNGDTLLHVICSSGKDDCLELLELLLASHASVNALNALHQTPLHLVCREIVHLSEEDITRTAYFRAAGKLIAGGADVSLSDSRGVTCLHIARGLPQLSSLLNSPVDTSELPPSLKWSEPKTHKHKSKISEVVRGRMSFHVQSYHYHKEPIGYGSFSHVYAGVDEKDGREVAVKRIEKDRLCRSEDQREISSLVKLCNCEDVVRYYCCLEDPYFVYIILELMEGTLTEFLDVQRSRQHDTNLCKDVVKGLRFFHELEVLHRDIKPDNILYKTSPRLCLKIADFGMSTEVNAKELKSVIHTCVGTRCWMAPELLQEVGRVSHSFASDVFACGLVLHYILVDKNHPFAPPMGKSNGRSSIDLQNETERNIMKQALNISDQLSPEAHHLIATMLDKEEEKRPVTSEIIHHPFFWSRKKKSRFLVAVGNQTEFRAPRHFDREHSNVEKDLEDRLDPKFDKEPWDFSILPTYAEMTVTGRRYNTCSVIDLVRFVRNVHAHVSDSGCSSQVKQDILENQVFLDKFPSLLIDVYNAVTSNGWHKDRAEIKSVLLDE